MLIPRHSLVCYIFSPRYARLAADVSQQAASLRWYRGSCSWVAILTQPQQIGVPYKVSTFSALPRPLPVQFLRRGKVKCPSATCAPRSTERKIIYPYFSPRNSNRGLAQCWGAMHDSSREVWQNKSCRRHHSTLASASCFSNLSSIFRPLHIFVRNVSDQMTLYQYYYLFAWQQFLCGVTLFKLHNLKILLNLSPINLKYRSSGEDRWSEIWSNSFALWQAYSLFVPHHTP